MQAVTEEQIIARKEIGGMSFVRGARGAMSMHGASPPHAPPADDAPAGQVRVLPQGPLGLYETAPAYAIFPPRG